MAESGSGDVATARALFRGASYPESSGGLDSSAALLRALGTQFSRALNAEYGSYLDGTGKFIASDKLASTLSQIKRQGYSAHVVVGQQQPIFIGTKGYLWLAPHWTAYEDYAYKLVKYVALQAESTGFQETIFEVGNNVDTTQNVLELWTLQDRTVAPGDDARYQHYMRVFQVWSRAVDRVARENPGRSIKIAGPAMGGQSMFLSNGLWHERFVRDVVAKGLRLDLVTHHFFGDIVNGWKNVPGSSLKAQLERIRQALVAAGRSGTPVAVTEYGPSDGSDATFGRINYSHESAAWGAAFVAQALAGGASLGSFVQVRDNFGTDATGTPGIASLDYVRNGVEYPKAISNAFRMYTLLPGTRKTVTVPAQQPDVHAFASAGNTSAGLIAYNYNFRFNWPTDNTDLTVNQAVTPGFSNLAFNGAVTVDRYVVDASTSNVAKFIDANQAPDLAGSALTVVESCSATVSDGRLVLPTRTLGPSAVSLWVVKSGAASGMQACSGTSSDTSGGTPSSGSGGSTGTGGSSSGGSTGTGGSSSGGSTGTGGSSSGGSTGTGGTSSGGSTGTGGSSSGGSTGTGDTSSGGSTGTGGTSSGGSTGTGGTSSGGSTGTDPSGTGGSTPPPSTNTGGSTTAPGSEDFQSRCSSADVIKCVSFDSAADLTAPGAGVASGEFTAPVIDSSIRASGSGSLKFVIPGNSGSDSSGTYYTNFSPDFSVQFGQNSEFYVQWRQRFSPEFVSTFYQGSGGIKQAIITTGDQPNRQYYSCEATEVVVQTYYMNRFPIVYNSCTGSASHGPYDGFYQQIPGYDFKLQNARPAPYCLYSQDPNFFAPNGNCFGWVANEWMTFQVRIKTGPLVNGEFTNSYVTLWAAREGQPSQEVVNWGPYNLTAGPLSENQRFGKVWLLPYQTGKSSAQAHATAYTWYDELIISRRKIADPVAGDTRSSPPAADTTPPTAPGAASATPVSSSQVKVGWTASTDANGVSGYKIERCTGSGCSNFAVIGSSSSPGYSDSGIAADTTYQYRISASDAAGNVSPYSAVVSARTPSASAGAPPAPPAPSGAADPKVANLAANTAVALGDYTCTDVAGEYPEKCKIGIGTDNGMVYDAKRNHVVIFGGGHASTNYDSVNLFDMSTLKWKDEYQPTACANMRFANYDATNGAWLSGASGPYPRAASRHTLDEMVVVGDELIVLAKVEGNGDCVEHNGAFTSYELETPARVAHYNFVTKTWSFGQTRGVLNYAAVELDPVSNKVILFGDYGLEVYDPATRVKTMAVDLGRVYGIKDEAGNVVSATEISYNKNLVYFPPNDRMYYFAPGAVFEIALNRSDFSKSTITRLGTSNNPPSNVMARDAGLAYDSVNKIIGGNVYQNVFYAFNPLTKSWTSRTIQNGFGTQDGHAITYDSANNVFVFISNDKKTWAYRYGTGQ